MIFIEDSKIYQFQNECMLFILVLWSGFCKYVEFCEIGGYLNNLIIGWGGGWVNVLHFFYLGKKQKRSYFIAGILPILESSKFITSFNQSSFVNPSTYPLPQTFFKTCYYCTSFGIDCFQNKLWIQSDKPRSWGSCILTIAFDRLF